MEILFRRTIEGEPYLLIDRRDYREVILLNRYGMLFHGVEYLPLKAIEFMPAEVKTTCVLKH